MPSSPHVLLVDDHAEVRAVLRSIVVQVFLHATIVEASNGAEALMAMSQHRPDLLITDVQMPIMGGLELLRTLREQGEKAAILVVSSDPTVAEEVLAAGATAFLPKPFPLAELRELLRTLLPWGEQAQAVGE